MRRELTTAGAGPVSTSSRHARCAIRAGAMLALTLSSVASAGPITVWFQDGPPAEREILKADRQTEGTLHLWSYDLRYPPEPEVPTDGERYDELQEAVANGKDRWNEFEIELPIARDLDMVMSDIDLVRSRRDRDELVRALLFQGAAVSRAFEPKAFPTSEDARPFRRAVGDVAVPRAWLDAYALLDRDLERSDFIDGTAWIDWQRYEDAIVGAAPATLTVPEGVGTVHVDGSPVEPGEVALRPGRHWIHIVQDGAVRGRARVEVEPGAAVAFPQRVDDAALADAAAKVLEGRKSGLDSTLVDTLGDLAAHHEGAVFLAAGEGSRATIVPFAAEAALVDSKLITFALTGDLGAGVLGTPLFDQNTTSDLMLAPSASAGLGMELGVSYFAVGAGVDAALTPGRTVTYGRPSANRNSAISSFAQPWGGIGAYFARPTGATVTAGLLATVQWNMPAHLGYGGRLAVGIPIDDSGRSWFRIAVGGSYGPDTLWDLGGDPQPMVTGFLRLGLMGRVTR